MVLFLHDIELPKHFDVSRIPSCTRMRGWLPVDRPMPRRALSHE